MKQYFLLILMVPFISLTGLIVGCNQEQAKADLQVYLSKASPIIIGYAETTETMGKANLLFGEGLSSSDISEVPKVITRYKATLEWALTRTTSELIDFKGLIPPQKAKHFHSLMLEVLTKEQTAFCDLISYYSSVLQDGSGDDRKLYNANSMMSEARQIWLKSTYELQNLVE